jgi:hypothetical protein
VKANFLENKITLERMTQSHERSAHVILPHVVSLLVSVLDGIFLGLLFIRRGKGKMEL